MLVNEQSERVDLAAQCFFNGLLKEFHGWKVDEQQQFVSIDLPDSDVELQLSYEHLSSCGPHKFIFPIRYLDGKSRGSLSFERALSLIINESEIVGELSDSARDLFKDRVIQSAANTANGVTERFDDLPHIYNQKLNFIEAEQALLVGHNMHPAPKSRSEFSGADIRYAPESGESFGLHWFAVHKTAWQGEIYDGEIDAAIASIIEDLKLDLKLDLRPTPSDYQLLPMHPWQVKVLKERDDIAHLFASDLILDLGVHGDGWRATTSLRAIYHPDCRFMLKYSLSVKLTNSVRHLSVKEVRRGMLLEKILDADKGLELQQRYPNMTIMREPGFVALQNGEGEAIEESLFAFRVNSFWKQPERESLVLASLTQADPMGGNSALANMVLNRANERKESTSIAAQQWFQGYLEQVLEPLVTARSDYGVIFLAHQQNIVVDIQDRLPVGLFYRDCQGTGFTCAAQECFPEQLREVEPENFMSREIVDPFISYYLIFNSSFSVISALASAGLVDESVLLNQLRLFMGHLKQKGYKDSGFVDYLLSSETLIFKGNFFVYLSNINENSIEDPSEIYQSIPNPLYVKSDTKALIKRLPDNSLIGFSQSCFSQTNAISIETPETSCEVSLTELDGLRVVQPSELSVNFLRLSYLQMLSLIEHVMFSKEVKGVSISLSHWEQLCFVKPPEWICVDDKALFIGVSQFEQNPDLWVLSPLSPNLASPECFIKNDEVTHPLRPNHPQGVFFRRFSYELGLEFSLRLIDPQADLELLHQWMNQPRVAGFWELDKPKEELLEYLQTTLALKHQFPVIGMFNGNAFGYFEYYWAKEDRLGPYYEADDYDRGVHLLIGNENYLGTQYWKVWGNYFIQYVFLADSRTKHLVGEPRIDNKNIIKLWQHFALEKVKEFHFPHKHAALVMGRRERFFEKMLRHYRGKK